MLSDYTENDYLFNVVVSVVCVNKYYLVLVQKLTYLFVSTAYV